MPKYLASKDATIQIPSRKDHIILLKKNNSHWRKLLPFGAGELPFIWMRTVCAGNKKNARRYIGHTCSSSAGVNIPPDKNMRRTPSLARKVSRILNDPDGRR
ncbi:hypothetical protein KCP75_05335 [Salmonella enterica subsp. enterica]|nr:hypothetical protein KCP75_05335 [Salmonella enterica subsp. enterica]